MTMRVGDVFTSYADFEVALSQYKKSNFVDFYIKDSKTAKSQINRYPKLANTSEQLKYYYVKLVCIHGGSYKKRKSCQDLRSTSTMRQGCEAFIYMIVNPNGDALEITRMNDEHNHEKLEVLYSHLPNQRKLKPQEKTEVLDSMELKANKKLIRNKMQVKIIKVKGLKDTANSHTTEYVWSSSLFMAFVRNASGNRCSLAYCTSLWSENNNNVRISFFKFPKDHARCTTWVENCEPKYLPSTDPDILHKTYKLCSLHFESQMFVGCKRLSSNAIPTLFKKKPKSQDLANSKISDSFLVKDDIDISSINDPPSCSTLIAYESQRNLSNKQSSAADCRESTNINDLNTEGTSCDLVPNKLFLLHQTLDNSCLEGNASLPQKQECPELNTIDSRFGEVVTLQQDDEYTKPNAVSIGKRKRKISSPISKKLHCEAMKSKGKPESELESFEKIQMLNKTVEATEHIGSVSERLVKIKENYYERKLKLKEIEIANNQQFRTESLAIKRSIADALNNIAMHFNDKNL